MQTTLLPFLTLRNPRPESIRFVTDFSRRTGDLEVLSKPDIHLLALTYELELERNGGDWRIRRDPGQKALNGHPPRASSSKDEDVPVPVNSKGLKEAEIEDKAEAPVTEEPQDAEAIATESGIVTPDQPSETATQEEDNIESRLDALNLDEPPVELPRQEDDATGVPADEGSDGDDSDGWITPSNLKAHQAKDAAVAGPKEAAIQEMLQAALLTSDFAMQNVALRINLKCVPIAITPPHSRPQTLENADSINHSASSPPPASRVSASSRPGFCAATAASPSRVKWSVNSAPSAAKPRSRVCHAVLTPRAPRGCTSRRTLCTTSAVMSTACPSLRTAAPTESWPM